MRLASVRKFWRDFTPARLLRWIQSFIIAGKQGQHQFPSDASFVLSDEIENVHAICKIRASLGHPPDENIAQALQWPVCITPPRRVEPIHLGEQSRRLSQIFRVPPEALDRPQQIALVGG